jgi:hypothetical protein
MSKLIDLYKGIKSVKPPPPSKTYLGSSTCKSIEIFRVCWDCSGEAMVKISALYHDAEGRYSPNKGQK